MDKTPLARLRIDVVGKDHDACRKLLCDLCDLIDADMATAYGYSVSNDDGCSVCDVDTLQNAALNGPNQPGICVDCCRELQISTTTRGAESS